MSGKKPAPKQIVLSKPVFEPPPSSAVQGKKKRGKKRVRNVSMWNCSSDLILCLTEPFALFS